MDLMVLNWTPDRRGLLDDLERRVGCGTTRLHVFARCVPSDDDPVRGDGRRFAVLPRLDLTREEVGSVLPDPASYEDLAAVIVLPDAALDEPDAYSGVAIRWTRARAPEVQIVAEIIDPEARKELMDAGADLLLERAALAASLIASQCVDRSVAQVFDAMLRGRVRVRSLPLTESLRRVCFAEAADALETTESERPITILGVVMGGRPVVNPGPRAPLDGAEALLALVGTEDLSSGAGA